MPTQAAVLLPFAEGSGESVTLEKLDTFLAELAAQQIDHLTALLNIVADDLEKNKTPEAIETVIRLIREELA